MQVVLRKDNQFGEDGPQSGETFNVFSFNLNEDGEVWFKGMRLAKKEAMYYLLSADMVEGLV